MSKTVLYMASIPYRPVAMGSNTLAQLLDQNNWSGTVCYYVHFLVNIGINHVKCVFK